MIHRPLLRLTGHIRGLLIASSAISFVTTAAIVAQMFWLSRIVHGVFMETAALADMRTPLFYLLGAIAARAVLIGISQSVHQRGAIRIKFDLRQRLYGHLVNAGPALIGNERTGELAATLTDGLEKIDAYFSRYLPRALHVMIAPMGIALFVLAIDPLSGALLLFTGPLIPIFMWLIGSIAEKRTQKQWTSLSRMSAHFLDVLQGLTTLKLFGQSHAQEREIRRISNRYRQMTMGVLKIAFLSGLVLELAASLSTAIVAVQIGIRLVEGHIPFHLGLFVLLLTPEFYLPFRQLGTEHHAAMEGTAAADRVFEILHIPILPPPNHPIPPPTPPFDIHLHQVAFCYPGRSDPALNGISTTFRHGEITAMIGPSGAGKSTLFHLLCRHLDPQSGAICIGNTDLQHIDRTAWRCLLSVVPQHPNLFQGTVLDNLRLSRPDASRDEIQESAQLAEAHDFIALLPQGYETPLGEQAWRLSGGERQRLSLARAFLKNAPILLLDEPGSNLDPESEEKLAHAFERLSQNRTVIVIAHRLRTISRADHIVVLDRGCIAEEGAPAELLERDGAYTRLMQRSARQ